MPLDGTLHIKMYKTLLAPDSFLDYLKVYCCSELMFPKEDAIDCIVGDLVILYVLKKTNN